MNFETPWERLPCRCCFLYGHRDDHEPLGERCLSLRESYWQDKGPSRQLYLNLALTTWSWFLA